MTVLLYLLNIICSAGQSVLSKRYAAKSENPTIFNTSKALSGVILFSVFALLGGFSFHIPTIFLGTLYGIFLCISMYTGFNALALGPIALTSMIGSFSLIIPLVFGIFIWGESLSIFNFLGILLLSTSIILLNFKKEKGISAKWSVYVFSTLIANGICSIIQKYHQIYFPSKFRCEFMVYAFLCVLIIMVISSKSKPITITSSFCTEGLLAGIMNSGANYIVLYLAAIEKASVLFPIISVTNVIAVFIIGRILFKERLNLLQISGLVFGIISILLINR